jgi:hypothetical protein
MVVQCTVIGKRGGQVPYKKKKGMIDWREKSRQKRKKKIAEKTR